jgi:hypothetical protein
VTTLFTHHGLPLLLAAAVIESFGIPVPGEGNDRDCAEADLQDQSSRMQTLIAPPVAAIAALLVAYTDRVLRRDCGAHAQTVSRVPPHAQGFAWRSS